MAPPPGLVGEFRILHNDLEEWIILPVGPTIILVYDHFGENLNEIIIM